MIMKDLKNHKEKMIYRLNYLIVIMFLVKFFEKYYIINFIFKNMSDE